MVARGSPIIIRYQAKVEGSSPFLVDYGFFFGLLCFHSTHEICKFILGWTLINMAGWADPPASAAEES